MEGGFMEEVEESFTLLGDLTPPEDGKQKVRWGCS